MKLHDSLDHAVADISADLPALVSASRKQGLSLRRRRRALSSVGTAAAVALAAVGGYALLPGSDGPGSTGTEVTSRPAAPLSGVTAPITGPGVVAALRAAVDDVADGTFSRFQGGVSRNDADASLLLRPDHGTGPAGQVMVNLQSLRGSVGAGPYVCEPAIMAHCAVRPLPGGDTLRTYREDDDTEFGDGSQRVVAEVLSPSRKLRVVVFSRNGNAWAPGEFREHSVLDTEQLTEIATQPWWSLSVLPTEYVAAGGELDLDGS
jgi:hypothetical protein